MSRRVRRWLPRWSTWMLLGLIALGCLRYFGGSRRPAESLPPAGEPLPVLWALDGDTLYLESGHRVRLIGVDTPETKHPDRPPEPWGQAAAEFTDQQVGGRDVILTYDRERLDAYRRILAYVEVDGRLLNEELIRQGYSRAVTSFPYRSDMQRRFRNAEREAQDAGRGIWSTTPQASPAP
jgi:micrococcal nuclease